MSVAAKRPHCATFRSFKEEQTMKLLEVVKKLAKKSTRNPAARRLTNRARPHLEALIARGPVDVRQRRFLWTAVVP